MTDYDFSPLNDKEFEDLSIALISKDKGKRFERFKAGRDGGIDGRYYCDDDTQEIIQCKHYLKTGYQGLISKLRREEVAKVQKLNPSKYIFVTSLPLSNTNKLEIQKLFDPYIKSPDDVYGQEALNDILSNNKDIEKRYYKLWLSNGDVLDRIFNNAIESRSEYLLEEIEDKIKYYETDNHFKALEKLEQSHIIIISGEAGSGKTTLANHLAFWYIEKGFKFYDIENSINEAESIYKRDEKQIFYFDDFLGSNYFNAIENKKDSHIVKFISRIKRDENKRFILTSRTHMISRLETLSSDFSNVSNEYIINIDTLSDIEKANILYNHLWYTQLEETFIDEIYFDRRYKEIIHHKNLKPRLIEFITIQSRVENNKIQSTDYWNYIIETLDNPQDIWRHPFEQQIDQFMRSIILLIVYNGNTIEESQLRNAYHRYCQLENLSNNSHESKEFNSMMRELVGSLLNRSLLNRTLVDYTLYDPSIADFVLHEYKNSYTLKNIFKALETEQSLITLSNIKSNALIEKTVYQEIIDNLSYERKNDINYLVFLGYLLYDKIECESLEKEELTLYEDKIHNIITMVIDKEENIKSQNVYRLLQTVSYPDYTKPFQVNIQFINKIINSTDNSSESDIREIIDFIEYHILPTDIEDSMQKIQLLLESYLLNSYDHPSFLTDEALVVIEKTILEDIEKQSKKSILQHLDNVGLSEYSYNSNQNIKNIKDNIDTQKIKTQIKDDILENIKYRLNLELFSDNNIDIETIENNPIQIDDYDEIDHLFQRQ